MLPGGLNYPHRYIRLIVLASSAERVYVEQVSNATWWAELPPQVHTVDCTCYFSRESLCGAGF
jgi:hypothetical protein